MAQLAQPGTLTTACCLSAASREENQVVETRIVGGGSIVKCGKSQPLTSILYTIVVHKFIYTVYIYSKTLKKS